jgi:methanogenic corrinoid protein MtbC1
LRVRGWRIVYLGADTPIETVEEASRQLNPSLVVLTAMSRERVQPTIAALTELARRHRLALGGPAAGNGALDASGILALGGDPIAEAARITALVESGDGGRETALRHAAADE